ncbi:hypothetical protein MNBD_GAMMA07-1281 [hydrothermal vent metagenome]|uniref:IncF plasmid conjugative transfer surface exclusion protein TraT n=1 Tax=hydrothermal vent metagenome TaxID=652676 RepID=A0A3B0X4C5_9ZZZZ
MLNLKKISRLIAFTTLAASFTLLSSCAALHTSIAKRNLVVQTKISTAIFVDAVKKGKRSVYVDIRSSVMEFDRRKLKKEVMAVFVDNDNGYTTTDDPDAAQYHLSIFVLKLEKTSETAADAALKRGFIGGSQGMAIASGAIIGSRSGNTGAGAVLGGLGSTIADAFVSDDTYMLVADVQIKEKARKGVFVRKDTKISTIASDAGGSTQRVSEMTNRKEYRTRIVTTANQANLDINEAQPLMFKKTAYAMAGFF